MKPPEQSFWQRLRAYFAESDEAEESSAMRRFLVPTFNRRFFLRLGVLVLVTYLVCSHVIQPAFTDGPSMLPTYRAHQFLPINRLKFRFREPRRGDVVMIRIHGNHVMYLKRIVAVAGDTVEFRTGDLYVNGTRCTEPWAHLTPCDWDLPPRKVADGHVYVVGDNRSMPMDMHLFGSTPASRIIGSPLW